VSGRMSFGALRIACGRARAIRRTQGAWVRPAAAKPRRVLCRPFPTASAREGTGGMKRMRIAPARETAQGKHALQLSRPRTDIAIPHKWGCGRPRHAPTWFS
jgi:hypothetical protein